MSTTSPKDDAELGRLGAFIRSQRKLMELSQRELARLTELSDPYVSQLERGLHQPSVRVMKSLANALNIQVETLLAAAGVLEQRLGQAPVGRAETEAAIRTDPDLTDTQKEALLTVYRSYRSTSRSAGKDS